MSVLIVDTIRQLLGSTGTTLEWSYRFFLAAFIHRNTLIGVCAHWKHRFWLASQLLFLDMQPNSIRCSSRMPSGRKLAAALMLMGQSDVHVHNETSSSGREVAPDWRFGSLISSHLDKSDLLPNVWYRYSTTTTGMKNCSSGLIWKLNDDMSKDHDRRDSWKCGNNRSVAAEAELWGLLLITWTNKTLYGGNFCGLTKQKHFGCNEKHYFGK